MNPIYYATMALAALSLSAGDAEAKRRKKVDAPEPVPAVVHLTVDEENRIIAQIYHAHYNSIEGEGKRAKRDYDNRLKNCEGILMALDFCSKERLGELERAVATHSRDIDEWTLDYSIVLGLSPEKKQKLEPLLVHYKTNCIDKRGKQNTAYCQELGADIFEQGTELSAPAEPAEEKNPTRT